MKVIYLTKRKILISFMIMCIILIFSFFNSSYGMQHYYKIDFSTGLVTASKLNVRSGPSTKYGIITTVNKNEYIRVFAGVGDWYIIQTEQDYVGAVNKKYVKPIYQNNNTQNNNIENTLQNDEEEILNLINEQRTKNGLNVLQIDPEVQKVAKIKAQDMVDNNYFSHTSPTYGSPFDMLKNFKISYKTAGENIAGNSSNTAAVTAWMNSEGHKKNILTNSFNYTGIGIAKSPKYGKIYVQIFIGK